MSTGHLCVFFEETAAHYAIGLSVSLMLSMMYDFLTYFG